ncbi:hypothetical protein D3C81_1286730 [compost metagenome]
MMAPCALKPAMVPKLGLTKCARRARAAVRCSSTPISVNGARCGSARVASSQLKNSHRAAPSCSMAARTWAASPSVLRDLARVVGLIDSATRTPSATAWRVPNVMRRGSSSKVAPAGKAASAAAVRSYAATSTPSLSRVARRAAGTLPSATNSVARSGPTSACARKTGL